MSREMNRTNPLLKGWQFKGLRVLLIVIISFHVIAISIVPSPSSLILKGMGDIFIPYINFIAMNASWQFFSPDPANVMYLEYGVFFEDSEGQELKESVRGFYPEGKTSVGLESIEKRILYATRFMYLDLSRLEKIFLPWLCRSHQGANRVFLKPYIEKIPMLEVAYKNPEQRSDRELQELPAIDFNCLDQTVMQQ